MRTAVIVIVLLIVGYLGYSYFFGSSSGEYTCNNTVMDGLEEDIDCGGLCEPCPNCYDLIQNQEETGVDCGGPCPPCMKAASCEDGLRNQGEIGVDCGGPCEGCPEKSCDLFDYSSGFRIKEWTLDKKSLKSNILNLTVDRIYLDPERKVYKGVPFDCRWGVERGEKVDLYYCYSEYIAPELSGSNVITGYIHKVFKIGLMVTRIRDGGKFTNLGFAELNATCTKVSGP